jgi:RES domain-containing protein
MRVRAHPRYAELKLWMLANQGRAVPFRRICFRVAGPLYTTADDIVSGFGARRGGGRWNPAGVMHAVYLSTDPVTAMAESLAHHTYFGLPYADAMPKVTVAVEVELNAVLDLTAVGSAGPIATANLLAEDWRAAAADRREACTQAIGRAASIIGLGGLIVPSQANPAGINVVIFPKCLSPAETLVVLQPDLLANLGVPT